MSAAIRLACRDNSAPTPDKALLGDITILARLADALTERNYVWAYESGPEKFFESKIQNVPALFQQLHATVALSSHVIRQNHGYEDGENIGAVREVARSWPGLRAASVPIDRELRLLDYLCTVRNKVVQHRGPEGQAIPGISLHADGFYYSGRRATINPALVKRARKMLAAVCSTHGFRLPPANSPEELFFHLELVAHLLWEQDTAASNRAFKLVWEARPYAAVVSIAMLANVDRSLGALLDLAAISPE